MEVWDEHGKDFLGKFKRSARGWRHSRAESSTLAALKGSALDVERESPCPYCPIKGE